MDKSRLEILPKVWLDYRRAIFLEEQRLLAVSDLHLGYSWAHRYHGQMLPLGPGDRLLERLTELCSYYKPTQFAFLGDIVHQAVPVTELVKDFHAVFDTLGATCATRLIVGNHDKKLRSLLRKNAVDLLPSLRSGGFLLLHGNRTPELCNGEIVIMGHEHPAISLGDGVKSAKFPCFLVSDTVLILPAFSLWAAGSDIRSYPFMSPLAQQARFKKAIAVCGNKLLPIPLVHAAGSDRIDIP